MKRALHSLALIAAGIAALALFASPDGDSKMMGLKQAEGFEQSELFDDLNGQPDVVYLLANSSVIFGPDPNGRSEEITFAGLVTVPKWPMDGYERRTLADGRQQIDIELVESELSGESYLMGGEVVLGEHPDLRSTGTITERPDVGDTTVPSASSDSTSTSTKAETTDDSGEEEEVPADFVVLRKVLLTTAKGVLYNETAVPVKGRVDSIPPVVSNGTPTGVNVFRGMELPVALLDQQGNVNGWFYSKAHMAYAVSPAAIERATITGTIEIRTDDGQTEKVAVSGPVEIHHGKPDNTMRQETPVEVVVLALRGHSELLGGDIMVTEGFSDRDRFSAGELEWYGEQGKSQLKLFLDLYTPSTKLYNRDGLVLEGSVNHEGSTGALAKGDFRVPLVNTTGELAGRGGVGLFDESEQRAGEIVSLDFQIKKGA